MDGYNGAGSYGGEVEDSSSEFQPGLRVMGINVDDGCPGASLFDCVRSFLLRASKKLMSSGSRVETSTVSASGEDKSTGWYDYDHTILRIPDATTEMPVGETEAVQESYGVFIPSCLVLLVVVLLFILFVGTALVVGIRKMKRHKSEQYPHSSPYDKGKYTYIGDV